MLEEAKRKRQARKQLDLAKKQELEDEKNKLREDEEELEK